MPVDVSMYRVPAAPELPNLLGVAAQVTQIRANAALAAARERELAEKQVLGEVMQSATDAGGKFDFGRAVTAVMSHPLTAARAPELAKEMLTTQGIGLDNATKALGAATERQGLIARIATGALESRVQQPDGQWGLDMASVTRGLAGLSAASPEMRGQVREMQQRLLAMSPTERYRAVEQAAFAGISAKEGLERVGSHLKAMMTPEGELVTYDTKRLDRPATVIHRAEPKPVSVAPGADLVSPTTGRVIYKSDPVDRTKPTVVPAGSKLVDPESGRTIAEGSARDPAIEHKVDVLVRSGVPKRIAEGIAAGRLQISRDPITNEATVVDMASGRPYDYQALTAQQNIDTRFAPSGEVPVPKSAPGAPAPTSPAIDLYGKQSDATGLVPAIQSLATDIVPQMTQVLPSGVTKAAESAPVIGPFVRSFSDVVTARQELAAAQNELIRALSVNPRFPVGEIQRLRKEIDIEPSILRSPEGMRARMRGLDTYLRNRLENELSTKDDEKLPADQRKAATQAARDIRNFLRVLNVPQPGAAKMPTPAEARAELERRARANGQ